MDETALINPARRKFLYALPAAAATGLVLGDASLLSTSAAAQSGAISSGYQKFSAGELEKEERELTATPGTKYLTQGKPFTMMLTAETSKIAAEFEWHEERDHIFQILDGATVIEVGGTPKGGHSIGPGEWRAPASDGAVSVMLGKGDMLVVPRGTPHKRNTGGSVTLLLISPQGTVSA